MKTFLMVLAILALIGCSTYSGSEFWRRSACKSIADVNEKARCLDEASRSENDYKQDVREATGG